MYTQNILEIYQNYANIAVAVFCAYEIFFVGSAELAHLVVVSHVTTDLLITRKPDIKIHHIITLAMYMMTNFTSRKMTPHELAEILRPFLITEISSIPYAMYCLISLQNWTRLYFIRPVLQMIFVGLFAYLRIYELPNSTILSVEYINHMRVLYDSPFTDFAGWSTIYAFIGLNFYWGLQILRKIHNQLCALPLNDHLDTCLRIYSMILVGMMPNTGYFYASILHHLFGAAYRHPVGFYMPMTMDIAYLVCIIWMADQTGCVFVTTVSRVFQLIGIELYGYQQLIINYTVMIVSLRRFVVLIREMGKTTE